MAHTDPDDIGAFVLAPGPEAAWDARLWVHAQLTEHGREDLIETTELAISELVTNALVHGALPVTLHLDWSHGHPRINVFDASPTPPRLPEPSDEAFLADVLATSGRGLALVARASRAWGMRLEATGKAIWFEPAAELAETAGAAPEIDDRRRTR